MRHVNEAEKRIAFAATKQPARKNFSAPVARFTAVSARDSVKRQTRRVSYRQETVSEFLKFRPCPRFFKNILEKSAPVSDFSKRTSAAKFHPCPAFYRPSAAINPATRLCAANKPCRNFIHGHKTFPVRLLSAAAKPRRTFIYRP